jgi:sulfur-oxidizing protein SoxY
MNVEGGLRRKGLKSLLLAGVTLSFAGWRNAFAQRMNSGRLISFEDMVQPVVKGAKLLKQDVQILAPVLADNGSLVPLQINVQSPMTDQDHVTHVYLMSQRNPVTQVAVFHFGPWNGRAEVNTRI